MQRYHEYLNILLLHYALADGHDAALSYNSHHDTVTGTDTLKTQLKLKVITDRKFQQYLVDQNCALREYMERQQQKIEYWREYVYYELTDEDEDISEDKELILQKKVTIIYIDTYIEFVYTIHCFNTDPIINLCQNTVKYYTPQVDSDTLLANGFKGEGITRAKFNDMYRVFVQSKGSGKRHLAAGTSVLYEKQTRV